MCFSPVYGRDPLTVTVPLPAADAVCGVLDAEERRALASAGLLLAPGASGGADEAARAYLGKAIACDPDNTCNYCGHRGKCEIRHEK